MDEVLGGFAAGALWIAPLLLLALLVGDRWRERAGPTLLVAYSVFFAIQVVLAKVLGAAALLTSPTFRIVYGSVVVFGAGAWLFRRGWHVPDGLRGVDPAPDADAALIRRMAGALAGAALCGMAALSLIWPVHVWDVLAYHMPMVATYVQNGTLESWPTQDLRQVYRVNAGELQLLNVALLAGSDVWVELPNVVGLGVFLTAAYEIARLAFPRRGLAALVVVATLTAPQILLGAGTAKNDLMFSAVLLTSFYWILRSVAVDVSGHDPAGRTPGGGGKGIGTRLAVALAALSGALAAATKVMGLNVLGAVGLLVLVLVARHRLRLLHVALFVGTACVALLALVGDVFWNNLTRAAAPVGLAPGELRISIGVTNLIEAARYYLYELPVRRLVTPPVFEHDFTHYGYLFPLLLVLGGVGAVAAVRARRDVLVGLLWMSGALFVSIIALRIPIRWDQRFMIWMVPVAAIFAVSLIERLHARYLIAIAGIATGLTAVNLALAATVESDSLFHRSALHLIESGAPARYPDVPNARYLAMNAGFDVLDHTAAPSDSVLYVGSDDAWMYLAWGRRFTRHVEGVHDAEHAAAQVASGRFRFVVIEGLALPELRDVVQREAEAAGYRVLVRAEGRLVLDRH